MKLNKEHIERAAAILSAARQKTGKYRFLDEGTKELVEVGARHLAAFGKVIGDDKPAIGFACATVRNLAGDALKVIKTFQ